MKNKFITFFVFCLVLFKSAHTSCATYNVDLVTVAKSTGKLVKCSAVVASILYSCKAMRDTFKSAKLVLPIGSNFKLVNLMKFPFNLAIKLPMGAFKAMKSYFTALGFGASAYLLYRIGF